MGSGKWPVRSASKAAAVAAVAQAPVVQPRRKGPSGLRAMGILWATKRVPAHGLILEPPRIEPYRLDGPISSYFNESGPEPGGGQPYAWPASPGGAIPEMDVLI
ncbi:hypothetical protein FRZ44_39640 [Hypericibacter terrae]|uniref:Uncharacterized protein n=1 Tax=Hypericibacter terrae TaxID=2602015 RepID=A0A5J6MV67_9PROT|nr:hypothetical protein FRZ44_39640 [Hypericibacter terrae]